MLVFNPHKLGTEMADATEITNFKQLAKMALELVEENRARRLAAGRHDIWNCPVIDRKTGKEMRFLNFDPRYQGRLDHAECCFKGPWRLASFEEEDAEMKKMAEARLAAARAVINN